MQPPPLVAVRGHLPRFGIRRSRSLARAMPRPRVSPSPSGWRAGWPRPASSSSPASRAASISGRTGQVARPVPSRFSPAASIKSIRPSMCRCLRRCWSRAPRSAKCRSAGSPRARFSAPQPHHLGSCGWSRDRRGGAPLRIAHHRAVRERAGARGLRRSGLAARSARRGHQSIDSRRSYSLHIDRRRDRGAGAADCGCVAAPWFVGRHDSRTAR